MSDATLPPTLRSQIDHAARAIHAGKPVVLPTDTVYGIACDPRQPAAVQALFKLKGRPETNPLPVLVASAKDAQTAAAEWTDMAHRLAEAFWPGPLTIVVRKAEWIPPAVVAGGNTVGLRAPDHRAALALIRAFGAPIACTSANRSGEPPAQNAGDIPQSWRDAGVPIIDDGPAPGGAPSTVIDATDPHALRILRPGPIAEPDARDAAGLA